MTHYHRAYTCRSEILNHWQFFRAYALHGRHGKANLTTRGAYEHTQQRTPIDPIARSPSPASSAAAMGREGSRCPRTNNNVEKGVRDRGVKVAGRSPPKSANGYPSANLAAFGTCRRAGNRGQKRRTPSWHGSKIRHPGHRAGWAE
jgi:hypothetical protein